VSGGKKIFFNTVITYGKSLITVFVSLFITRKVLEILGASDYGIYMLVAGVASMLTFLNAAMSNATQRFISVNLGKGDHSFVKKIFANSVLVHFLIGVLVVLLIEVFGMRFIEFKATIDPERVTVAKNLLHFISITTFITIISVPYDALILAKENMLALAIFSIIETFATLIGVLILSYIPYDKLLSYGVLMMVVSLFIRLSKRMYSQKKYSESRVEIFKQVDKRIVIELTSFASWSLFGVLCVIGRNQGVAVMLNIFFSTVINAAYGIANQINAQLMYFSQTLMNAMRPQIMKNEGAGNRNAMIDLALKANKYSFFLFTMFALPFYQQLPLILQLWLKDVPPHTVEFCKAILLLTMMNQMNMGVMTAVQAIGKIKVYQTIAGGIQLLTLPVGYVLLKWGHPPHFVIWGSFVLETISTIFRAFYFSYLTAFPVFTYLRKVSVACLVPLLIAYAITYNIATLVEVQSVIGLMGYIAISFVVYFILVYILGLESAERHILKSIPQRIKNKLQGK